LKPRKKPKLPRKVDPGWATIIAAALTLFSGVLVVFFQNNREPETTSTSTRISPNNPIPPTIESVYRDEWPRLFYDDFASADNAAWKLGKTEGSSAIKNAYISNGKMIWDVQSEETIYFHRGPAIDPVSDFNLTVEINQPQDSQYSSHGIYFGYQPSGDFYAFSITNLQYWSFVIYNNEEYIPIIDWKKTAAIRPKNVNKLKIVAEGSHFVFFVNDKYIGEADDTRLPMGEVGLGVTIEADEVSFEFDNFDLRTPSGK
jgi:hypothetical protein